MTDTTRSTPDAPASASGSDGAPHRTASGWRSLAAYLASQRRPRRGRDDPHAHQHDDHDQGLPFDQALVDCGLYVRGVRQPDVPFDQALDSARAVEGAFVWIGLYEPRWDAIQSVATEFGLHPLAVEDAVHAHQRPKVETYDDSAFLVLKTVRYVDPEEVIETGEIMLFVGQQFLVSVRHGQASSLQNVRHELEAHPDLMALGPSAVTYAIVDRVADDYELVIDDLSVDIDQIEQQVFSNQRRGPTERLYKLKREVLEFRRAVTPLTAALGRIADGYVSAIDPRTLPYFRDVHDHATRAAEQVSSIDELLTGAVQANLAQVSMRQNEDMRKISAWVAILGIITAIAGIYGMNFVNMPELQWKYGYFVVLGIMAVSSLVLHRLFKRSGWL